MKLNRKGNEVYFEDRKLTIVKQETKGPGKEVVKIEGLPGSNGQKWVSLTKLVEGENTLDCQGREVTSTGPRSQYTLTAEEAQKVKEAQKVIDDIINAAKARYVKKPDLNIDPSKLTEDERMLKILEVKAYYNMPLTQEEEEFKKNLEELKKSL